MIGRFIPIGKILLIDQVESSEKLLIQGQGPVDDTPLLLVSTRMHKGWTPFTASRVVHWHVHCTYVAIGKTLHAESAE